MAISQINNNSLASGVPASSNMPAGSVLQVVNGSTSTYASTASNAWSDTGLTVTITPKFSTSKILVLVSIAGVGKSAASTTNTVDLQIVRNSTAILQYESMLGFNNQSTQNFASSSANYLDSPATTSATVYKVQFASDLNTDRVYVQNFNTRASVSTITVMEIAG